MTIETSVEWIAVIFSLLGLIKILSFAFSKTWWINNVSLKVFEKPKVLGVVFLVLAVVVFYYLFLELTLAQIIAGAAFGSLLTGLGLIGFSKELRGLVEKVVKRGIDGWLKLLMLIWIVLLGWTLYSILI
jgi:hypothetical protein